MLKTEKTLPFEPNLQPLALRIRSILLQCAPKSLATLTLLAGFQAGPISAATITVNAGCTLVDAIHSANFDFALNGCRAGSGADTIVLPANSVQTLTAVNNNDYGPTGLPVISSTITIAGNGSTIQRDPVAPQFRILAVINNWNGNLTLNSITVSGGSSVGSGGGIYKGQLGGVLTLNNSVVSGNSTQLRGGGIYNYEQALTLNNSTVSGNSAGYGGGLYNKSGNVTINGSTVSGNSSIKLGGGISNISDLTLNNSTVSGNRSLNIGGGGINNWGGDAS